MSSCGTKQVNTIYVVKHLKEGKHLMSPAHVGKSAATPLRVGHVHCSRCSRKANFVQQKTARYRDLQNLQDVNHDEKARDFAIACVGALLLSNAIVSSASASLEVDGSASDSIMIEMVEQNIGNESSRSAENYDINMKSSPDVIVDQKAGVKPDTKSSKRKGRIRELEEIKAELAKKELELLSKENALLEKEQSVLVLRQELEIERNIRALITKEKEQAEEEAALAMGLCTGSTMLP